MNTYRFYNLIESALALENNFVSLHVYAPKKLMDTTEKLNFGLIYNEVIEIYGNLEEALG